jgi:hypothetical protein
VEIFPNPAAFLRLATAVVIETHGEWQVTRRYVSDVSMGEVKAVIAAKERAAATGTTTSGNLPDDSLATAKVTTVAVVFAGTSHTARSRQLADETIDLIDTDVLGLDYLQSLF